MNSLIKPYQGELRNLLVSHDESEVLKNTSGSYPAVTLTQRQACDLELIMNGALSPLTGFMNKNEYDSVLSKTCLPNGAAWSLPYCLDIDEVQADKIKPGSSIALRDTEGFMPAVMIVESIWKPDKNKEAEVIYGTTDKSHPGVKYLFNSVKNVYLGGVIKGIQQPFHYDFETLRNTPLSLRKYFKKIGWKNIVAFHTSKPMHRVHHEITMRAAKAFNANILIHPVVGMSKPGDMHYYARVHCYQAILDYYPKNIAALSLLPLAMRMAGPREALMNAIVRQNYGCSHYIVGTEHAAPPGIRDNGLRFYPSGASQEYVSKYQDTLDIKIITTDELCYARNSNCYITVAEADNNKSTCEKFPNDKILDSIYRNIHIPDWVTYPEVLNEMRKVCSPRHEQGFTLFFTGLSGSGKSTLAKIMYAKFIEAGERPVTLLDGDIVRHNLSNELGFSKSDRDINVKRIGFVASEIVKNKGIAICAPIAPYDLTRKAVRETIEQYGAFIEIYVATPLEVCEQRDRKGLYAKARKGLIPEFTGISDPYEVPDDPELNFDTSNLSPMAAAQEILLYLIREGYIAK